jgi:hypothetical protein
MESKNRDLYYGYKTPNMNSIRGCRFVVVAITIVMAHDYSNHPVKKNSDDLE